MPDNTPNDWNADEQFWADAWDDMEGQLDQIMPVAKKRRRRFLPLWLLGAFIPLLAFAWLTFFTPTEQENGPLPMDTPAQTIPASPLTPKVSTEGDVPLAATDPGLKKQNLDEGKVAIKVAVLDERPAKSTAISTEPVQSFTSTTKSIQTGGEPAKEPQATGQITNAFEASGANPSLFTAKETKVVASIPSLADNPQRVVQMDHYNLPPSSGRGAQAHPNPRLDSAQAPLNRALNSALAERISPAISSATYQPHLFVGGSLGTQSPGLGYSAGIGLGRDIGKKGRLTATLGYRVQRESVQLGGSSNQNNDGNAFPTPNATDTTGGLTAAELSALNDVLNSNEGIFLRNEYIRFGLNYAVGLGNKFYLSAGAGLNLLTRSDLSVGFSNENPLANFTQRSGGINLISNDVSFESTQAGGEPLEDFLGLRRLRYDLNLMAGYRLSRHFSVEAGVKHYVSPVLNPDNFSSDRWRGEVKILYRF